MAMVASAMADAIIKSMSENSPANAADAATVFQKALSNYVFENCQVMFSWVGIFITPVGVPTPDPVVSFTAKVSGTTNLPIPFLGTLPLMGTNIKNLISSWMITPNDSSFAVTPTTFLPMLPPLILSQSMASNQKDAMTFLCNLIIANIKLSINPIPVMGAHGTFTAPTGVGGIMTSIM